MCEVTLHIHLRLLAIGRCGQRNESKDTRAHALGDGSDGAALAGCVASLEHNDNAFAGLLDPVLQRAKLGLKLAQLLLIVFALKLGSLSICLPSFRLAIRVTTFLRHQTNSPSAVDGLNQSKDTVSSRALRRSS